MSVSFNLVDREWIPCVTPDGDMIRKGILAALVGAGEFKEIRDESPLVTVSLHRMLLAILHRVFGPESPAAWGELWNKGGGEFDAAKLKAYLYSPGIHSRFDLFDAKHPFYQTQALPLGEPEKKNLGRPKFVKPIWQMAHELAYSDSMNLFAHFKETDWETRPVAEAARWLVAFQGFALGGRITFADGENTKTEGSADAGQLTKSALILAKGDSLFQTLMLNLIHYSEDDNEPFAFDASADRPAWERDKPVRPADRPFDGYVDLLTWQSRRVKLVPELDEEGNVRGVNGVAAMKGFQLPGFDRHGRESMVGFVKVEKATSGQDPWPPLGFRLGKELWRDSHAIFQSVAEKSERPKVLSWVDDLGQEGHIDRKQIQIDVIGMCANQAKITYWRHETFPLPLAYLHSRELVESLKLALKLAEEVGREALHNAARATVEARLSGESGMKPDKDRVKNILDSFAPERLYWSRLELPYRELLVALADVSTPEERSARIAAWFWCVLHKTALAAFDNSIGQIDGGRDLKAATIGRGMLERFLKKVQTSNHIPDREPKKKEGAA